AARPRLERRAMFEAPPPPPSPFVIEQVEHALALYRGLVPDEFLDEMGRNLELFFTQHPAGAGLVACLVPAARIDAPPRVAPGRWGFMVVRFWRATFASLRESFRSVGRENFIMPAAAMDVRAALLEYAGGAEAEWRAMPEPMLRELAPAVAETV